MHRFIARQPILDRYEKVYGYELFFRPGEREIWPPADGGQAGDDDAPSAPYFEGIDDITDGARVFIKCTRQALLGGHAAQLPRDRVVLEMLATLEPDQEIVTACRGLKDAGFLIALENLQGDRQAPLADLANIIKLDVTASADRAQWLLIRKYRPKGTMFVAEKVDTRVRFQAAVQQGYSYFQGQFFLRPQPFSTPEVSPTKLVYFRILQAVTQPEINVEEVADTLKHDLALSYKLLRFLNSAWFAFRSQIKSIRHGLLLLGQNEIRKWIGLISVAALGEGAPPILVTMALVRAAFCESLAPLVGAPRRQPDYFFLGLLSSIDILMGRPLRLMLAELPIAPDVSAALLGEQNTMRDVLQTVISYEQGNWGEFSQLAKKLEQNEETLCELYMQALYWSGELGKEEKEEPVGAPSN
jgi:EAL and modified HD-GYP domain-containing signal transduction protein